MIDHPDSLRLPVGVVVERRPATSPWAEWVWKPAAVLLDLPEVPPWTLLREEGGVALFYAGAADITLFPTDTDNYRHALQQTPPRLWVVLRPDAAAPQGWRLQAATVDAGEAEIYAESPSDLTEPLPMPPALAEVVEAYVARYHKERIFHKRRRDRADPEALARRPAGAEETE
jgi:hypothetical protein